MVLAPPCVTSTPRDRAVGWRVNDPHSHSAAVRALYLHPEIHRTVGLVLGQRPIAIQSVYFEFGSEQAMHRDPMFVRTSPPSHFVAVWVALDEITEDNGPILAVPGSHRAPWYEFERDTIVLEKTDPETHASASVRLAAAPHRDARPPRAVDRTAAVRRRRGARLARRADPRRRPGGPSRPRRAAAC